MPAPATAPAPDALPVVCRGLRKRYPLGAGRWRTALDEVDLELRRGEIFGLLGPNGAGKSTLLKILLGLLRSDAGTSAIWGREGTPTAVRRWLGFVPEQPFFPAFATGREVLGLHASLLGLDRAARRAGIERVARRCGLEAHLGEPLGGYSKGIRQRLALAQSLLGDPPLLIMDEPTSGLDPEAIVAFGRLLGDLRREGQTILLCTHHLAQAEAICDRVAILHRGRIVLEGETEALRARDGHWQLRVQTANPADRAAMAEAVAACGGRVEGWEPVNASLETLFLDALKGRKEDA